MEGHKNTMKMLRDTFTGHMVGYVRVLLVYKYSERTVLNKSIFFFQRLLERTQLDDDI